MLAISGEDINASFNLSLKTSRKFALARISLIRAACPSELRNKRENKLPQTPIVVECNRLELGKITTGYYPEAVVTCGAYRRNRLLENGTVRAYAWCEVNALDDVKADHRMSASELLIKVNNAVASKSIGPSKPVIVACYPLDGSVIYASLGKLHHQSWVIDPTEHIVRLSNQVTACNHMNNMNVVDPYGSLNKATQPVAETGGNFHQLIGPALTVGSNQTTNTGGSSSDLITMLVRDNTNIAEAANAYLRQIKGGLHNPIQPSFYPVKGVQYAYNGNMASTIGQALLAAGLHPVDFAIWCENNKAILARDFSEKKRKSLAKTGAALPDGSYPIVNESDLGNAVRSIGRAKDPAKAKRHIIQRAKQLKDTGSLPDTWNVKAGAPMGNRNAAKYGRALDHDQDEETSPQDGVHQAFTENGFKQTGSSRLLGRNDYKHSDGRVGSSFRSGEWWTNKPSTDSLKTGNGEASLRSHLSTKVSAGGSNSGRHPGGKFHSALKAAGYSHEKTDGHGTAHYRHPDTGHKVKVQTNGVAVFQGKGGNKTCSDPAKLGGALKACNGMQSATIPGRIPSSDLPLPSSEAS